MNKLLTTLGLNRAAKIQLYHTFWILLDIITVITAYSIAYFIRTLTAVEGLLDALAFIVLAALVNSALMQINGVYRRIWKQTSGQDIHCLLIATFEAGIMVTLLTLVMPGRPLPLSVILVGQVFSLVSFTGFRYRTRLATGALWRYEMLLWGKLASESEVLRVLVVGAGSSGQAFVQYSRAQIEKGQHFKIVGFVDDDLNKQKMMVEGKLVLGTTEAIPRISREKDIDLIVMAIHNISGPAFRRIVDICQKTEAQIKVMPNVFGLMNNTETPGILREVRVEDIIGRSAVPTDVCDIDMSAVTEKVVLVTGAAGSIGSELSRQLTKYQPRKLLLLDNNESGLYDLMQELKHSGAGMALTPVLCDVTDRNAMRHVFEEYRPQVIFHAAAYKHVPLLEDHPYQAVRVNVGGTLNAAHLAQTYDAERFVLVSSDKAVNSTSVMGATKYICEQVVQALVDYSDKSTLMTAVRFGNVLGSRGSVVPLFEKQINAGGPITVTDERMTRYFMSIPEAAHLVIQAACLTRGQDLFLLEMGESVRIVELAERMIRLRGLRPHKDIPIKIVGARPGEELHEKLTIPGEKRYKTEHPYIMAVRAPQVHPSLFLNHARRLLNGNYRADELKSAVLEVAKLARDVTERAAAHENFYRRNIIDFNERAG